MSIYNLIYNWALKKKEKTSHLAYGRHILIQWVKEFIEENKKKNYKILDIGCGEGNDLMNIDNEIKKQNCSAELYGIEYYEKYRNVSLKKGIHAININLERDHFPYKDNFFDIIIINQVTEHIKEIFYVYSEISRILKNRGLLIVGVPNLAAYHDRFSLLLGQQPTSIKILGPHIRGITYPGFKNFIESENFFKLVQVKGSGFYPFSEKMSLFLSKLFPTLSTAIFFKIIRTDKRGTFIKVLEKHFFETNYYKGQS